LNKGFIYSSFDVEPWDEKDALDEKSILSTGKTGEVFLGDFEVAPSGMMLLGLMGWGEKGIEKKEGELTRLTVEAKNGNWMLKSGSNKLRALGWEERLKKRLFFRSTNWGCEGEDGSDPSIGTCTLKQSHSENLMMGGKDEDNIKEEIYKQNDVGRERVKSNEQPTVSESQGIVGHKCFGRLVLGETRQNWRVNGRMKSDINTRVKQYDR
jgi:hypothetical protein